MCLDDYRSSSHGVHTMNSVSRRPTLSRSQILAADLTNLQAEAKEFEKLLQQNLLKQQRLGSLLQHELSLNPPVHRLPVELLGSIFATVISNHSPLIRNLLLVCHRWNEIIMEDTLLWSNVIIQAELLECAGKPQAYFEACLSRTKGRLLDLTLDFTSINLRAIYENCNNEYRNMLMNYKKDPSKPFPIISDRHGKPIRHIMENCHLYQNTLTAMQSLVSCPCFLDGTLSPHVRSLIILFPSQEIRPGIDDAILNNLFGHSFPFLEILTIESNNLSVDVSIDAPMLKKCNFTQILPIPTSPESITELSVSCKPWRLECGTRWLLPEFQNVTTLSLCNLSYHSYVTNYSRTPFALPNLLELHLLGYIPGDTLALLDTPNLKVLDVGGKDDVHSLSCLAALTSTSRIESLNFGPGLDILEECWSSGESRYVDYKGYNRALDDIEGLLVRCPSLAKIRFDRAYIGIASLIVEHQLVYAVQEIEIAHKSGKVTYSTIPKLHLDLGLTEASLRCIEPRGEGARSRPFSGGLRFIKRR